jgi:radical SAM protein with 4Fe4S-binding SPASM domain
VTNENYNHIAETYRIAKKLRVDVFRLQFGIFTTASLESASSRAYRDAFGVSPRYWKGFIRNVTDIDPGVVERQIKQIRLDAKINRGIIYRQIPSGSFDIYGYFINPERNLFDDVCTVAWKYIQIMPNGDIVLCMDFADLVGGNIRKVDWREVWNGEQFRKFRLRILRDGTFPACSRCCTYFSSISDSRLKHLTKILVPFIH